MSCFGNLSQNNASGTTVGGSLVQLIALGAADAYLSADPDCTFWRLRVQKCTNFAMESILQTFNSQVQFGSETSMVLNRTGDLIFFIYFLLDLPAITAVPVRQGDYGVCNQFPCPDPCDPCQDGQNFGQCNIFRNQEGEGVLGGSYALTMSPAYTGSSSSSSSSSTSSRRSSFSSGSSFSSDSFSDAGSSSLSAADAFSEVADHCGEIDRCTGVKRPYAHWVNEIGHAAIQRASFSIGGQIIDTLYNHYLHMWEELSGQPGKRLEEMIGKRATVAGLVADSSKPRRLYVPLPFYFTRASGNALPLVSLQFHALQININLAPLSRLIQVSDCNTKVIKCQDSQPISAQDCRGLLDTTYIYLDMEERDRFATGSFQQLIDQVQEFSTTSRNGNVNAQLSFNNPVTELIWAVQRRCVAEKNFTFNYAGMWGQDPITNAMLRINNLTRFQREAPYFRMVQPYQYHTDIPKNFIYVYSFGLQPEGCQPCGSLNFSRIDSTELQLCLQPQLTAKNEEVALYCFARNKNILRLRDGLGGVLFSS